MSDYVHPMQAIYDKVPAVECKGLCGRNRHNTCCGPIGCTVLEAVLLDQYDGIECEWETAFEGCVRQVVKDYTDMVCPHLGLDGRCRAYEARPLICRVWGATKRMRCPHGCEPKRWLSEEEFMKLMIASNKVSAEWKPLAEPVK